MALPRDRQTPPYVRAVLARRRRAARALRRFSLVATSFVLSAVTVLPWMVPESEALPPASAGEGTAIWRRNGSTSPLYREWNGTSFDGSQSAGPLGQWRVMQGAASSTRNEVIVAGVKTDGWISGGRWDGSAWAALPFTLNQVSESFWWSMDLAYESQSGDALLVWANGTTGSSPLSYRVWNGSAWGPATAIAAPQSGEAKQLQLASAPGKDEMVLVVSNASSQDYALVWNGSAWGNAVTLDADGGEDRTDVAVTYLQQSGRALVAYGDDSLFAMFRTWNGTTWGAALGTHPGGLTGNVRWLTVTSIPGSDGAAFGVLTFDGEVWFGSWDGIDFGSMSVATTAAAGQVFPAMAVAAEASGQVLATYAESGATAVRYRTFTSGGGWTSEQNGPDLGAQPNSMTLDARPGSDQVMLAVQDDQSDLHYAFWNGSSWGTPTEVDTDTGETKNQPFLFLWDTGSGVTLSGTIYEDVNGDASLADGVGAAGASVHLYQDKAPTNIPGVEDTLYQTATTGPGGTYSFSGVPDGNYWVAVDSTTISPAAPLLSGHTVAETWAEQTWAPKGGVRYRDSAWWFHQDPGEMYGGLRWMTSDGSASFASREHIARMEIIGGAAAPGLSLAGIDFGFSFNAITRTGDGDDRSDARSVQGSLRQAIQNGNALQGTGSPLFRMSTYDTGYSGGVWTTNLAATILDPVTDPLVLDATTQPGYGGTPVVEVNGAAVGGTDPNCFTLAAGNSTLRGFAINRCPDDGIEIEVAGGNVVEGNYVGTNPAGTVARPNGYGISVKSSGNRIGGPTAAQGNLISGNTDWGLGIYNSASGNAVQGNRIGVSSAGAVLGNGGNGVEVYGGAAANTIGGRAAGEGNTIASNGGAGVFLSADAGSGNTVVGNASRSNGGLGIDLAPAGVTPNDAGDADTGPNGLQNFPLVTSAVLRGAEIVVSGTLSSTPNATFEIDLYSSPTGDPTGYGEGVTYLGRTTVTTNGSGAGSFSARLPSAGTTSGQVVTATATAAAGSTSEFGATATAVEFEGMILWRTSGDTSPNYRIWDGASFGPAGSSSAVGDLSSLRAAESPTRDEIIVIGRTAAGSIVGEIWDGASWSGLPGNPLGSQFIASQWVTDVTYESLSGDGLLVWGDGTGLKFNTWNGSSWSDSAVVSDYATISGGTTAARVSLASNPHSNAVVLAVTDNVGHDYVFVWNGSSWGSGLRVSTNATGRSTASDVAYQTQSGRAMVVYEDSGTPVYYRTWDGSSWSAASSFAAPGGVSTLPNFLSLVSDPISNRLAFATSLSGLPGSTAYWLNAWTGSAWGTSVLATATGVDQLMPGIDVAFEGTSGQAIAAYAVTGSAVVRYRTWDAGSGWSAEQNGPTVGAAARVVTLATDPYSDRVMLAEQDGNRDLYATQWSGSAWNTATVIETDTGETSNQPFGFVWDHRSAALVPHPPDFNQDLGDRSDAEGAVVSLPSPATDPDGDPLAYSATGLPPGLGIDPSTGLISGTITYDASPGSPYSVVVRVQDPGGLFDTDSFTWTVTDTNQPPAFDQDLGDRTDSENTVVSLPSPASDLDGDSLVYSATGLPPGLAIDPATGLVSGIIAAGAETGSPYAVEVRVQDPGGLFDTDAFTWTVAGTNHSPEIVDPGDQQDPPGAPINLAMSATDPDGDPFSWSATGLPPGLAIHQATGVISGVITGAPAVYEVEVTATDDGAPPLEGTARFTWTVSTDLTITKGSDAGGHAVAGQTITYTIIAVNPGLGSHTGVAVTDPLPAGTSWVSTQVTRPVDGPPQTVGDTFDSKTYAADSGTINWTGPWVETNDDGSPSSGGIVIHDHDGRTVLELQEGDRRITRAADLSAYDRATLTYQWKRRNLLAGEWVVIEVSGNGGGSWTEVARHSGPGNDDAYTAETGIDLSACTTAGFQIRLRTAPGQGDNHELRVDDLFVEVTARAPSTEPGGAPPALNPPTALLAGESMTITLVVRVDDPLNPAIGDIANIATVTSDQQAVDDSAATHDLVNRPPTFNQDLGDRTDPEGTVVSLPSPATDLDGDLLTYAASELPPGLAIDPATGLISGTVTYDAASGSPYAVVVRVEDPGGLLDTDTFTWTVTETDRPPTFDGDLVDRSDAEGVAVSAASPATDLDGDALTWSASGLPPGLSIDPDTGLISGTISYEASPGSPYPVLVRVEDPGGLFDTDAFTWTVPDTNRAPVLAGGLGNRADAEGNAVSLPVPAVDPDGDVLIWSANGLPPGLLIDPATGLISGTIGYDASPASPYLVVVRVEDPGGLADSDAFAWTVTDTNRPPVVTDPGPQGSGEGQAASLNVLGLDPDGDGLAWSATGLPPGLGIDPVSGTIAGVASYEAAPGSPYTVTVRATDDGFPVLWGEASFLWTVSDTNRAPLVGSPGDRSDAEGQAVAFAVAGSDPDGDTLAWSATGLPPGLSIDPATGFISGTLTYEASPGSPYGVTVTATDDGTPVLSSGVSLLWVVTDTNRAPQVLHPGDRWAAEGDAVSVAPVASDPDGDALAWMAHGLPPGLVIDPATGRITGTLSYEAAAQSPSAVTLTVNDGGSPALEAATTFTFTVADTNRAPLVTDPGPQSGAEGDSVLLVVAGSDPDGDALTWSATGLPSGLSMDPATGLISGIVGYEASASPHIVGVTAADDGVPVLTAGVAFTWTVADTNRAPRILPIPDQQSSEGEAVSLALPGWDPDGDAVAFSAAGLPPGLTMDAVSGAISGTLTFEAGGAHRVTVTLTDDGSPSRSSQSAFTWQVSGTNRAPEVTSPGDRESAEGEAVTLAVPASDPDGDRLTWSATGLPPGVTLGRTTGVFSGTPTAAGRYTVTVTVADPAGATVSATFRWVVDADLPPEARDDFVAVGRDDLGEAGVVVVEVLGNDVDPEGQQLALVEVSAPEVGEVSLVGETVVFRPPADWIGTVAVAYRVADPSGQQAEATVTILVRERLDVLIAASSLQWRPPDGAGVAVPSLGSSGTLLTALVQSLHVLRVPLALLGGAVVWSLLLGGALNLGLAVRRGLPAVLSRRGRLMAIVMAAQGAKVPAFRRAGGDEVVYQYLATDARIKATGRRAAAGGKEWLEVLTEEGAAWVESVHLTEHLDRAFFAEDRAPWQVLEHFVDAVRRRAPLTHLVSRHGLWVAYHTAPVHYAVERVAGLWDDGEIRVWKGRNPAYPDRQGTFDTAVAAEVLDAYDHPKMELVPDQTAVPSTVIPVEFTNLHFISIGADLIGPERLDQTAWLVHFSYEDGKPRVIGLCREG